MKSNLARTPKGQIPLCIILTSETYPEHRQKYTMTCSQTFPGVLFITSMVEVREWSIKKLVRQVMAQTTWNI